jgi:phage major head subunit gpT-like protein
MFEKRAELVKEWRETIERSKKVDMADMSDSMVGLYGPMIEALSKDDYENWDNYPHDVPYIVEMEVLES